MTQRVRKGIAIPIKWEGVEESPLIFANSLLVQHTDHEFIITFAQIHPPITLGLQEEEIAKIESVSARAAVRIVLPPTRLQELIRILNENYQKYLDRISALEQEGAGGGENV